MLMMMATTAIRDGNSDGNGDGNSNSNDAAATANGYDVDEDDGGNLRMAIGRWQLNANNWTTTM
jgi:hypothetical protein